MIDFVDTNKEEKEMKKSNIALIMCIIMLTAILAGCGSGSDTETSAGTETSTGTESQTNDKEASAIELDGSWPAAEIIIGVECFDTTDEQFLQLQEYYEYLAESYNISFMYSESIASAEAELDFISSCASAGAKAIIGFYNVTEEEAAQQAIDQGMCYWGTEYYSELADEDLYLGSYEFVGGDSDKNGEYLAGYELGYGLAMADVTHILYCNGGASFGVQMFIDRQEGFNDGVAAAQNEGADVAYDPEKDVLEGWPGTDEFTAAQSAALSSDYDGVATSFNVATWFQPIADAGKSENIKLAAIGEVEDTYYESINSGQLVTLVYDCEEVVFGHIIASIMNAVNGDLELTKNEAGSAGNISVNRWVIKSADDYNAIYEYHEAGNYFISAAQLTECFPEFNEAAAQDSINDLYKQYTLDYALSTIK